MSTPVPPALVVRRRYVDTSFGQVHVAETGRSSLTDVPVVLLHQTPRSWDEYREVLPLLGARHHVIALDTPGMGASDPVPGEQSIEAFAVGIIEAIDVLGIGRFHLVGHHTGGVIAVEVAATMPERVDRVVLSSTPWIDASDRVARRRRSPIDAVEARPDGGHLCELWQRRRGFYPDGRPDLLNRFVRDALAADDPEAGHRAVGSFEMEKRIGGLAGLPILLVGHADDPHAFPYLDAMRHALPHAEVREIATGVVPLEFTASEFADLVDAFLA